MARRLALSLRMLRELHPGACETDVRVLQKDGDGFNLSLKMRSGTVPLEYTGTRDLRLLAKQLEWFADRLESIGDDEIFEEIDP